MNHTPDPSALAAASALDYADGLKLADGLWQFLWLKHYASPWTYDTARKEAQQAITRIGDAALAGKLPHLPPQIVRILREESGGHHLLMTLNDLQTRRLWARHRIAYQVDPDLWDTLGETGDDDLIPPEVFDYLPHPDPYVRFPQPLVFDHGGTQIMRVEGVGIVGHIGNAMCSTAHPDRTGLTLIFHGPMYDRSGKRLQAHIAGQQAADSTYTRVGLVFPGRTPVRFADLVAGMRSRFVSSPDPALGGNPVDEMEQMVRRALSVLLYLCSVNAEVDRVPAMAARRVARERSGKAGRTVKPPKVLMVGHRVGAAIRAYRKNPASWKRSGTSGRTVPPHVRRSHFHTFRYGPGRELRRLRWLPPIPVNMNGDADTTTVIAV